MIHYLFTAAKVAGVTYRFLATTTMIGVLVIGVCDVVSARRKHKK